MIEILKSGFYDTIQDLGRHNFQEYGVPLSGVMDAHAASFANRLLGNIPNEAVLEITMTGPKLLFHSNTFICISGADMSPCVNGKPIKMNYLLQTFKGDILSFGKLKSGLRSYLAVIGGFQTETVLQSKSMYQGITKSKKVMIGDLLPTGKFSTLLNKKHAQVKINNDYINSKHIKVFKGPEFDQLNKSQIEQLFSNDFHISKNNNRMAYQLEGLLLNQLTPILTSLVMPGTIQLTPDGNLIILMRDCQTTGGYPRILQLEEKSRDIIAQKFMGQEIKFQLIS